MSGALRLLVRIRFYLVSMSRFSDSSQLNKANNFTKGGIFSVESSGVYTYIPTADDGLQTAWPVPCHLELVYNQTNIQGVDGPPLIINSAQGLQTTYAQTITITATGPATVAVTPTTSPSSAEVISSPPTSSAQSATEPSTPMFPHSLQTSLPPPPTGLSKGAKAGIGIGVAIGSLIALALVVFAVMQQKQLKMVKKRLSLFDRDVGNKMQPMLPVIDQRLIGSESVSRGPGVLGGRGEEAPRGHELEARTRRLGTYL